MRVQLRVNGVDRIADDVWPGESLMFTLRERLGLPGTKNACEQGECGSCTVLVDGLPVCCCLIAAPQAIGCDVVTVEGLAEGDGLDPVQEAFVEAGAVQCGFCTPGLVVAVKDLVTRNPTATDGEIREALAGNLCRCTGYEKILDAVRSAAGRVPTGPLVIDRAAIATVDPAGEEYAADHVIVNDGRIIAVSAVPRPPWKGPAWSTIGLPAHPRARQHAPSPLPVGRAGYSQDSTLRWLTESTRCGPHHRAGRRRGRRGRAGLAREVGLHDHHRPPLPVSPWCG